mmetsp:Transcript_7391/g.10603  ORF Transcript_7391/g.10603 Transcript_7391/m.10603 type:complete len:417 (-) Transcript_7391:38-1288(-)
MTLTSSKHEEKEHDILSIDNIGYGDSTYFQLNQDDTRWLVGSHGDGNKEVHTRNLLASTYEGVGNTQSHWILRSTPGDGTLDGSQDPKRHECVKYGDTIYLQNKHTHNSWMAGGQGFHREDTSTMDLLTSSEMKHNDQWIIRSNAGSGDVKHHINRDPHDGACVITTDYIYLQSNSLDNLWLASCQSIGSQPAQTKDIHIDSPGCGGFENFQWFLRLDHPALNAGVPNLNVNIPNLNVNRKIASKQNLRNIQKDNSPSVQPIQQPLSHTDSFSHSLEMSHSNIGSSQNPSEQKRNPYRYASTTEPSNGTYTRSSRRPRSTISPNPVESISSSPFRSRPSNEMSTLNKQNVLLASSSDDQIPEATASNTFPVPPYVFILGMGAIIFAWVIVKIRNTNHDSKLPIYDRKGALELSRNR